jgi:hypothetical protein
MGTPMVVLVLPAAQFGGELTGRAERGPSIELFLIRAVAAFDLAVDLGAARRNVPMGDAEVAQMPVKSVPNSLPWSVCTRWMAMGSRWRTSSMKAIAFGIELCV